MVSTQYFERRLQRLLPGVNIVYLEAAEDFFNGNDQGADALLLSYEEGAAYSYRYPQYTAIRTRRAGGWSARHHWSAGRRTGGRTWTGKHVATFARLLHPGPLYKISTRFSYRG